MLRVRLSARADVVAAQRAIAAISDAFVPLRHAPMIDRPVEDHEALRELVADFGATGYLALYCFEPLWDVVTILAIKHQREDDYK